MIKIIGLSALALGFILHFVEWLYDFKLNGWSFATVISVALLIERTHHNHQTRLMLKIIGTKVGVEWQSYLPANGLKHIYPKLLRYSTKLKGKKEKKMKDYVKKLGRTKLQVYIVFTIVNIFTLFATLSGVVDVNTAMQPYMPFIDLGAQLGAGWIYTHYQGKVDVVTAQNGGIPNVDTKPTGDSGAAV